jgi:hypothetical protein
LISPACKSRSYPWFCGGPHVGIFPCDPAERPDAKKNAEHGLQITAGDHLVARINRDLPKSSRRERGSDGISFGEAERSEVDSFVEASRAKRQEV